MQPKASLPWVLKGLPLVPDRARGITSTLTSYVFNIILPSTLRSPMWSLSFRFPGYNLYVFVTSSMRATYSTHFKLNFIVVMILRNKSNPASGGN
jgi:hypothetical protein